MIKLDMFIYVQGIDDLYFQSSRILNCCGAFIQDMLSKLTIRFPGQYY